MKKVSLLVLFWMTVAAVSIAQKEETLFGQSGLHLSGAWGGFSNSITQFNDDYAYMRGGFGGLEFNESIFIGWGGYRLRDDVEFSTFPTQEFDMHYKGMILGFGIDANKIFHPSITLMGGSGQIELEQEGKDKIFVLQPSAGLEINVFRWLHLGLEGGYRIVTDTDIPGLNDADLSAPYGEIRFRFGWSWGR